MEMCVCVSVSSVRWRDKRQTETDHRCVMRMREIRETTEGRSEGEMMVGWVEKGE